MNRCATLLGWVVALAAATATAVAANPEKIKATQTRIIVDDMHCAHCAKKIARKLFTVSGVKHVRAVVKTNTATVTPAPNTSGQRTCWEGLSE